MIEKAGRDATKTVVKPRSAFLPALIVTGGPAGCASCEIGWHGARISTYPQFRGQVQAGTPVGRRFRIVEGGAGVGQVAVVGANGTITDGIEKATAGGIRADQHVLVQSGGRQGRHIGCHRGCRTALGDACGQAPKDWAPVLKDCAAAGIVKAVD